MRPYNKKRLYKAITVFSISLIIISIIFYKIDNDLKPLLFSISQAEVRIAVTDCINRTVKEELLKDVKYSDFVNVKTDKNGEISAIELNTVEMNKFGNSVALKVQDQLKFIGGTGVGIPLGVLTGSSLPSYYGPNMNVKVMPLGNIVTDFKSEIQSAGINQTRYRVYISVSTNMQMMIPLGKDNINVVSSIPIAETLIVGKVPASYFNTTPRDTIPSLPPIPANDSK